MSIDMSQFHGVFIEESHEHLDTMERLLMALDINEPDLEELNSIFRAAHSIKGGSSIFGFDALTSVTHVMENLFDKARQNQFTFTTEVIDELLQAVDLLCSLLNDYSEGRDIDLSVVEKLTIRVEGLLHPKEPEIEGFGFFDEKLSDNEEDEGFGFFKTPNLPNDDEGFGFFDEESTAESTAPVAVKDDEGFGFFDEEAPSETKPPAPAKQVLAKPAPAKTAAKASDKISKKSTPASGKAESVESSSIRVDISKVDSLVNLAGELVITQSMLNLLGAEIEGPMTERLQSALAELERNTRELQESIMSIRMLPLSFVFNRFPRVVRDLSTKLNKQVELVIEGGHTEIDKGFIERLVDPLTHLVRNSLDHGIEVPELRRERGKADRGTLTLRAEQKGGNILISVIDDGAGLNRERILEKALEKGIELPDNPSDQQVWQLIMAPGFSTAAEVTDVSGRGVGMDVVKRNIEAMSGQIEIFSTQGECSEFQIHLPLTLAILDGMSVAVSDQLFIIPLVSIIESVQPSPEQLKNISNQQMLELRSAYWPIVRLHKAMNIDGAQKEPHKAILVLIETSKARFALLVDDLIGQQQVVIKSLEQHYRRVQGVAGATIMGDGSVALILDVESLSDQVNETDVLKGVV
jgi:two-component system chemotaxis sensor kinase CheA